MNKPTDSERVRGIVYRFLDSDFMPPMLAPMLIVARGWIDGKLADMTEEDARKALAGIRAMVND